MKEGIGYVESYPFLSLHLLLISSPPTHRQSTHAPTHRQFTHRRKPTTVCAASSDRRARAAGAPPGYTRYSSGFQNNRRGEGEGDVWSLCEGRGDGWGGWGMGVGEMDSGVGISVVECLS